MDDNLSKLRQNSIRKFDEEDLTNDEKQKIGNELRKLGYL